LLYLNYNHKDHKNTDRFIQYTQRVFNVYQQI